MSEKTLNPFYGTGIEAARHMTVDEIREAYQNMKNRKDAGKVIHADEDAFVAGLVSVLQ